MSINTNNQEKAVAVEDSFVHIMKVLYKVNKEAIAPKIRIVNSPVFWEPIPMRELTEMLPGLMEHRCDQRSCM
jgi:hypothetical protein